MLTLKSVDFSVLPDQMLDQVKAHMRVEFTRDDDYIRGCIARAIAEVEAATDISIAPAIYLWTLDEQCCLELVYCCSSRGWRIPKTPVRLVTEDIGGVQTQVDILQDQMYAYLPRDAGSGPYTLAVGYGAITEMAPSVVSPILMIAATLYETRESLQAGMLPEVQDMARRLFSGLWCPSV